MSDSTLPLVTPKAPRVAAFLCNWCSYTASDLAGTSRIKYSPCARILRVMCSGRVDPALVLKAFALGADGVLIAGCHPGDCHYIEQNYKTMRRHSMLQYFLGQMGIEEQRLRLVWASAAEGQHLAESIDRFVGGSQEAGSAELVRELGRERATVGSVGGHRA